MGSWVAEVGVGVGPLCGGGRLVREWLGGLTSNPALPASVPARLLTVEELPAYASSWLAQCSLDAKGTAVLAGSARIGHRLAAVGIPACDVEVLAGPARDPVPRVRFAYAALVGDFGWRVPEGCWRCWRVTVRRGCGGRWRGSSCRRRCAGGLPGTAILGCGPLP